MALSKNIVDSQPSWFHQRTVRNLVYNLLYDLDLNRYEPIPFARLDNNDALSAIGDVVIVENKKGKGVVMIQVVNKRTFKEESRKLRQLMDEYPYLQEVFLVDYETEDWYKIDRARLEEQDDDLDDAKDDDETFDIADWDPELTFDSDEDSPSFSRLLQTDFVDFVELPS